MLQDGQYEPVGEDVARKVDVRVIAATNLDLRQEARARRFRQDLFYRLNVFPLERATILCEGQAIRPEDLSLRSASSAQGDSTDLEVLERRTIERVMRDANGNKVEASRQLGISRMQLYGRLRKYGLETRPGEAPDTDEAHTRRDQLREALSRSVDVARR